jgi:hypothetical protein
VTWHYIPVDSNSFDMNVMLLELPTIIFFWSVFLSSWTRFHFLSSHRWVNTPLQPAYVIQLCAILSSVLWRHNVPLLMLVSVHKTTGCHNSEDHDLNSHCHKYLKIYIISFNFLQCIVTVWWMHEFEIWEKHYGNMYDYKSMEQRIRLY